MQQPITKTELLTKAEINSLKKELLSDYLTSFLFFLIIVFSIHLFALFKFDRWIVPDYEIIILIISGMIFYLVTFVITRSLRHEIQNGFKIIEVKLIEQKYDYIDKQDRFSPEYKKYVMIADKQKFIVTEEQYKNAEINDLLLVHKTPLREMILKIETSPH